jgi:HEAT repeat protein
MSTRSDAAAGPEDEIQWRDEEAVLRRAATELAEIKIEQRAAELLELAGLGHPDSFNLITESLDDPSHKMRNAAARALFQINSRSAISLFNGRLREASLEERRRLGAMLVESGLARDAIAKLDGRDAPDDYDALSVIFLLAKAGEIGSLLEVIEHHPRIDLRLAIVRMLGSSGEPEIGSWFHRLSTQLSLPREVRSAVMQSLFQRSEVKDQKSEVVS